MERTGRKQLVTRQGLALAVLAGMALGLGSGCGKPATTSGADAGLMPEAVAVRKAFESSGPSYRNPVEEMLALVRAGSVNPVAYAEAMPQLERLAGNPTLSSEQKRAVEALVQKLKSMGVKSNPPKDIR